MEKITIFGVASNNSFNPVVKRTTLYNGESRFELLDPEFLTLPSFTELVSYEETTDPIKTAGELAYLLSAQSLKKSAPEVILSSTVLREDIISNDFDEIEFEEVK